MYRSAAKRLLQYSKQSLTSKSLPKQPTITTTTTSRYYYSSSSPIRTINRRTITTPLSSYSFGGYSNHFLSTESPPTPQQQTLNPIDPNTTTTTTSQGGEQGARRTRGAGNYEEEQSRVLAASLPHVLKLGWSEAAMIAGARDVSLSPSIVGSIPRKEAALVEYFMDECLQKLIDEIDSGKLELQDLVPSERIAKLVKTRLEIQAPYISKWPQALSIQAQPLNFSTSFKQRAMLVDEFCHAASDEGSGVDWYLKRTALGGIYSTTEIYMLTDNSTDFNDTWMFLNDRVRDAFDLKKTIQEMKYFTEAVGAGVGGSFQGFMKKGC